MCREQFPRYCSLTPCFRIQLTYEIFSIHFDGFEFIINDMVRVQMSEFNIFSLTSSNLSYIGIHSVANKESELDVYCIRNFIPSFGSH